MLRYWEYNQCFHSTFQCARLKTEVIQPALLHNSSTCLGFGNLFLVCPCTLKCVEVPFCFKTKLPYTHLPALITVHIYAYIYLNRDNKCQLQVEAFRVLGCCFTNSLAWLSPLPCAAWEQCKGTSDKAILLLLEGCKGAARLDIINQILLRLSYCLKRPGKEQKAHLKINLRKGNVLTPALVMERERAGCKQSFLEALSCSITHNCSALTPTVKNPLTGRNLLQPGSNWRDSESLGRCMPGQSRTLQPAVDCASGLQPLKILTFSHDYFYLTFVFLLGKTCSFFLTT